MSKRPEYVRCIRRPMANSTTSWCGRPLALEWAFTGLDHAVATRLAGERLLACTECIKAATKALET